MYFVSPVLFLVVFGSILSAQSVSATPVPHSTDPDCTSYTSPQNGAFVEACATPSGITFGYANEPPSEFEAVQFTNQNTNKTYEDVVQMPASGTQCKLNSAGSFTPTQTSCTFSVSPLDVGCYLGFANSTDTQQVKMTFTLCVNSGDPPFPGLPTSTSPPQTCDGGASPPITGFAASYTSAGGPSNGYWKTDATGGVSAFGSAVFHGSMGGCTLNEPIVGMVSTPTGGGYWLVASDGGTFAFGDAQFYGSTGSLHLNAPIVSLASTSDDGGYWLVAKDGGIFSYGDAQFYGSTGSLHLNAPIVSLAATPNGGGYWLVAADGGIFAFGNAGFFGSTGSIHLNAPIVGMVPTSDGNGYFLVAADGGVFAYGDAHFSGSAGGNPNWLLNPAIGVVPDTQLGNASYWLEFRDGTTLTYGGAPNYG